MKIEKWNTAKSKKYLKAPKKSDHKYSRGVLGCITGSNKFPGAALISTESALACGVGMVRYFGPRKVKRAVLLNRPEIVIAPGKVDVYLLGPGVPESGAYFQRRRMGNALDSGVPIILDAGALNLIEKANARTLITPHVSELAKVFALKQIPVTSKEIERDPISWARRCADLFNVTVLLKGNKTVLANQDRTIELPQATTRLATAGTGDALAGIIGAIMAINHDSLDENNLIEIGATGALIHAISAKNQSAKSKNGPLNISQMVMTISHTIGQISS